MAIASFVAENATVSFDDLNDATKNVVEVNTVVPVTKDVVNYMSLELNALSAMLHKLTTSLAFEQKLEAICACQQVGQVKEIYASS